KKWSAASLSEMPRYCIYIRFLLLGEEQRPLLHLRVVAGPEVDLGAVVRWPRRPALPLLQLAYDLRRERHDGREEAVQARHRMRPKVLLLSTVGLLSLRPMRLWRLTIFGGKRYARLPASLASLFCVHLRLRSFLACD